MKKFDVFFSQINYTAIEVEARGPEEAKRKAAKIWREEYATPHVEAVQPAKG